MIIGLNHGRHHPSCCCLTMWLWPIVVWATSWGLVKSVIFSINYIATFPFGMKSFFGIRNPNSLIVSNSLTTILLLNIFQQQQRI